MKTVTEHLNKTDAGTVLDSYFDKKSQQEVLRIAPQKLREICQILKKELQYDMLIDIFGIDWLGKKEKRFEVDYLFYNTKEKSRTQLKIALDNNDKPSIDSITDIFAAANWAEREIFDMYGIHVDGHPNLRRLLMWKEFEGYPLRKDYPIDKRQPIPVLDELL